MTHPARSLRRTLAVATLCTVAAAAAQAAGKPHYKILDLGVVGTGTASQATAVSPDGKIAVGRELTPTAFPAMSWSRAQGGGLALPNLAGRSFAQANGVNDAGTIVGTSTTTSFGSGALPVLWQGGAAIALPLPAGQTVGRASAINAAGVVVGSIGSDIFERGAIFGTTATTVITATAPGGQYMTEAYGVSDGGIVVGDGVDPANAALNVGLVYDTNTGAMTTVGALPDANGALAFGVSTDGTYVTGSSMQYQGSGRPYVWSATGGIVEIPLPPQTESGSGYAVNSKGWVVGNGGGLYSVPFVYAEGKTYPLYALLPAGSTWDFKTNTSASAKGITDAGTIVGTAVHEGATHAYAMVLVK